jgi:DNA-binding Lrp family transcriptional regulator
LFLLSITQTKDIGSSAIVCLGNGSNLGGAFKMGRPRADIDELALIDMATRGFSPAEMAGELGVSIPTLQNRIKELQEEQSVILQYRAVKNLHLTQLQAKCLEAINPGKIAAASLRDLVIAFKTLHEAEYDIKAGEGGKVSGLVSYLLQIEKEEISSRMGNSEMTTTKVLALAQKVEESEEDAVMRALREMIN